MELLFFLVRELVHYLKVQTLALKLGFCNSLANAHLVIKINYDPPPKGFY